MQEVIEHREQITPPNSPNKSNKIEELMHK